MDDSLIYSQYNVLFKTSTDIPLLYNSESNNLLELAQELYSVLELISENDTIISHLNEKVIKYLVENKILVSKKDQDSHKQEMHDEYVLKNVDNKALSLTILPTCDCNFKCSYCFEEGKMKGSMSDETIDDLITFIKSYKNLKSLSLLWFGGEPLMACKTIVHILDRIKEEVCIPITRHRMITNGYFINKHICDIFKQYKISWIQLTLDGLKDTHNRVRVLKTGVADTYNTIINNINLILKECPEMKIRIRINVSQDNVHEYWRLKKELNDLYKSKSIEIYPGFIFNYNSLGTELISPSLTREQKKDFFLKGDSILFPIQATKICSATEKDSFIIGPMGEMYKCLKDINVPNKIISYLDGRKGNLDLERLYMTTTCFSDEECMNCFLLPLCSGGCCRERIKKKYQNGKFNLCTLYKDRSFLEKCLEDYYMNKKKII